jgi:hypothetical protein
MMDEILTGASVPVIAAAVYWLIELIKYTVGGAEKFKRFIPLLSVVLGVAVSLIAYFFIPSVIPADSVLIAVVIGGASGLSATGFHQIVKQIKK